MFPALSFQGPSHLYLRCCCSDSGLACSSAVSPPMKPTTICAPRSEHRALMRLKLTQVLIILAGYFGRRRFVVQLLQRLTDDPPFVSKRAVNFLLQLAERQGLVHALQVRSALIGIGGHQIHHPQGMAGGQRGQAARQALCQQLSDKGVLLVLQRGLFDQIQILAQEGRPWSSTFSLSQIGQRLIARSWCWQS